jgi:4-hydroxyphenylpyruvate dioxygenase-like putative hemolysin
MFRDIHHIAFVYRDHDQAIKEFKSLFGIEKFNKIDMGLVNVTRSMIGRLQIDLIEPKDNPSIFNEFLDNGNAGLHHIGFLVDNIDDKIEDYKSKGYKEVLGGIIGPAKFIYFDTTEDLGHITELMQIDYNKE